MKKSSLVVWILMVIFLAQGVWAQDTNSATDAFGAQMMGGLGFTMIDGKLYYRVLLMPELSLGKFGVGLNGDLLFNQDGLRKEDWNPRSRWVRIVRYLRWGWKHDPVYARVGALDATTLGHGFIVSRYSNQAANDVEKKLGMEFDLDFGLLGFESMVSNFGRAEIYGGRGYVRPLRTTGIPIIKALQIGATVATDVDPDRNRNTSDGVTIWGLDLGLPIINTSLISTGLYYDFAKINNLGRGSAFGLGTNIKFPGDLLTISAKLEQRFLGKQFVPQYIDRFYEVERFQEEAGLPIRKTFVVSQIDEARNGTYGELAARLFGKLDILGSYQYTYNMPRSGVLHMGTTLSGLIPKLELAASYDHKGIGKFSDLGRLDENFLFTVEGGYEVYTHIMLYLTYQRTYEWRHYDEDNNPLPEPYYKAVEKFSPRVAMKFKF